MNKEEYYKLNPEVKAHELINFNLFRKLSHSGGRPVFVQFHRKGAPFGTGVPSQIYIHGDDVEDLLKSVPKARINQRRLPCGKIAFMLMTTWYNTKVLDNSELDFRAKIEITVHCLNEALRFIHNNNHSIKDCCDALRIISTNLVSFTYSLLVADENRENLLVEVFYRNKNHLSHAVRVAMYTCFIFAVINRLKSVTFEPQVVADSVLGVLIHDEHFWQGAFSEERKDDLSLLIPEVMDMSLHMNTVYERDYIEDHPVSPMYRIATIADAFDELTACNHSFYVFSHLDAFVYLKQRLTDRLYRPYLELFMKAFCSPESEMAAQAG